MRDTRVWGRSPNGRRSMCPIPKTAVTTVPAPGVLCTVIEPPVISAAIFHRGRPIPTRRVVRVV